jgi:drug/metabolite transporter (DMT)-like permease
MIFGLGAAVGWGFADVTAALVARRIGSFRTLVFANFAGLLLLTVLVAATPVSFPALHPGLVGLPLIGILGAISYVAFYRALELGPIALVSPVAAGYAAIVIGLSLLVLGERVPGPALIGAGLTTVGVVLASTAPRGRGLERTRPGRAGMPYAVVAMIGFGVGAFLIGRYSKDVGWFGAIFLSRLGSSATLLVFLLARQSRPSRRVPLSIAGTATLVGLLDVMGFASFARGTELGFITITAAASVTYPLIPIVSGVIYLRERPQPTQWLGVAVVIGGLLFLALGR